MYNFIKSIIKYKTRNHKLQLKYFQHPKMKIHKIFFQKSIQMMKQHFSEPTKNNYMKVLSKVGTTILYLSVFYNDA